MFINMEKALKVPVFPVIFCLFSLLFFSGEAFHNLINCAIRMIAYTLISVERSSCEIKVRQLCREWIFENSIQKFWQNYSSQKSKK